MANALYPLWKANLLQATAGTSLTGTLKVALSTAAYNSAHQFYSSVSASTIGTPQTLGSKTYTGGVVDAADVTYTAVTGAQVTALIIYLDTGTGSTSALVAFIDTGQTGLPVTPNGGDISIVWNASGIFAL
jgi:hypothetical protein